MDDVESSKSYRALEVEPDERSKNYRYRRTSDYRSSTKRQTRERPKDSRSKDRVQDQNSNITKGKNSDRSRRSRFARESLEPILSPSQQHEESDISSSHKSITSSVTSSDTPMSIRTADFNYFSSIRKNCQKNALYSSSDDDSDIQSLAESMYTKKQLERFPLTTERRNLLKSFEYARKTRKEKFGDNHPFGILGLYDHLMSIRTDIQWSEEVAWRKKNNEHYICWSEFNNDKRRGIHHPIFTNSLIFACTIMLMISIHVNGWKLERFSDNPMLGPSAETLVYLGAKDSNLIVNEGEFWRIFSPMILHAGFIHYLFNIFALSSIGTAVEISHGTPAAVLIFMLSTIGGNILSAIFLPKYISVGASGGIFGLIGACLADILIHWRVIFNHELNEHRTCEYYWIIFWLMFDILLNFGIGLTPLVDNFTHMGGLIYGFFCGLITMDRISTAYFYPKELNQSSCKRVFQKYLIVIVSISIVTCGLSLSLIFLYEGDGQSSPCTSCQAMSCVSLPPWKEEKWWYCDSCNLAAAEARVDYDSGIYDALLLYCPDGESIYIDLGNDATEDKNLIENNIPTYCRSHCQNTFI